MARKKDRRGKHIPQRTCVGCREVEAKGELVRLVLTNEGVLVDESGKLPGRGAYVHGDPACMQTALKGSLENALRTELDEEERTGLLADWAKRAN